MVDTEGILIEMRSAHKVQLSVEEEKEYSAWAIDTMFNTMVAQEFSSHSTIWRFCGAESMDILGP